MYTPFGETWVEEASTVDISHITRFFTNQQYDKESGLYYYNARYYDPHLGSFITPDPKMANLNHYTYCSANPIKYTDPTGLDDDEEDDDDDETYTVQEDDSLSEIAEDNDTTVEEMLAANPQLVGRTSPDGKLSGANYIKTGEKLSIPNKNSGNEIADNSEKASKSDPLTPDNNNESSNNKNIALKALKALWNNTQIRIGLPLKLDKKFKVAGPVYIKAGIQPFLIITNKGFSIKFIGKGDLGAEFLIGDVPFYVSSGARGSFDLINNNVFDPKLSKTIKGAIDCGVPDIASLNFRKSDFRNWGKGWEFGSTAKVRGFDMGIRFKISDIIRDMKN